MNCYLTYSIYYNQAEWYKLLQRVYSYVNDYNKVSKYFIKLSVIRGPHIELTTCVEEESQMDSVNYFSKCLNAFLKDQLSSNTALDAESHLLFSDFPNNTVHYGVHDYVLFPSEEREALEDLHCNIANILFSIFEEYGKETTDMDTEIMLQLFAIFCLASNRNLKESIVFFEEFFEKECNKFDNQLITNQLRTISQNFEKNKESILEYLNGVLVSKAEKIYEGWEGKWHTLIKDSVNTKIDRLHESLIHTICMNMNFNDRINALAMFLQGIKSLNDQEITSSS